MEVVIDCGGVGYAVSVPLSTLDNVPPTGEIVTLLTHLAVREDAMQLYGFLTKHERDVFHLLTSIQGIGGRIALGILSASTLDGLKRAILAENIAALQRLPGIGKKTAERIVVELREKVVAIGIDVEGRMDASARDGKEGTAEGAAAEDAISALQALGYSKTSAEKAVHSVLKQRPDIVDSSEELIRAALRQT
jgi:holliday junction DNA helicase RuvA